MSESKLTTANLAAAVELMLGILPGFVSSGQDAEMGETYVTARFDDGHNEISVRIIVECPETEGPSRGKPVLKGTDTTFGKLRDGQQFQVGPCIAIKRGYRQDRAGDMYFSDTLADMMDEDASLTPDTLVKSNCDVLAPTWDVAFFEDDTKVKVM